MKIKKGLKVKKKGDNLVFKVVGHSIELDERKHLKMKELLKSKDELFSFICTTGSSLKEIEFGFFEKKNSYSISIWCVETDDGLAYKSLNKEQFEKLKYYTLAT